MGIWPLGLFKPAAHTSIKRPKGTPVWHNKTCDRDSYRAMMMNNVITAICDEWPDGNFASNNIKIYIQHDGAPGHFDADHDF